MGEPNDRERALAAHPLLFSGPMIRALMRESFPKTQTRRPITKHNSIVDGQPCNFWDELRFSDAFVDPGPSPAGNPGPYLKVARPSEGSRHRVYSRIQPGDLIWVKETWSHDANSLEQLRTEVDDAYGSSHGPYYRADGVHENSGLRWRPSIHMPRWASRITLEVLSVTPTRLQDISEEDALAEGCSGSRWHRHPTFGIVTDDGELPSEEFRRLWGSIHGADAWERNPWVRRIEFRRVEQSAERLVGNG